MSLLVVNPMCLWIDSSTFFTPLHPRVSVHGSTVSLAPYGRKNLLVRYAWKLWATSQKVHYKSRRYRDSLTRLRWVVDGMDGQSIIRIWIFVSFKFICASRFLTLNFNPLGVVAQRLSLDILLGNPFQICQRLLATLWQISYRGQRELANPLANYLQGIRGNWQPSDKFLRVYWHLLQRIHICQPVLDNSSSWQRVLDNLQTYLQEGWPANKESATFLQYL